MASLIVVERALVKDGGQTVCRHYFDIATIWRVFEHTIVPNRMRKILFKHSVLDCLASSLVILYDITQLTNVTSGTTSAWHGSYSQCLNCSSKNLGELTVTSGE